MPGRLGPRFAIEALFLIALAVGAAYADLASKWIVLVMAGGWLVVALLELSADRIWAAAPPWRRPYYVPVPPPRQEAVAEPAPPPESAEQEPDPVPEPEPEAATAIVARAEPAAAALPEPGPATAEPGPVSGELARPQLEPLDPKPKRRWFRRREREAVAAEAPEIELPKHVRLLPASEQSPSASDEVAELFDLPEHERNTPR